jgi:hypothetical protein
VILRPTLTTAELVGENADEWEALEQLVRLGQRTSMPRTEDWRLRGLATRLRVPLRVEGIAVAGLGVGRGQVRPDGKAGAAARRGRTT